MTACVSFRSVVFFPFTLLTSSASPCAIISRTVPRRVCSCTTCSKGLFSYHCTIYRKRLCYPVLGLSVSLSASFSLVPGLSLDLPLVSRLCRCSLPRLDRQGSIPTPPLLAGKPPLAYALCPSPFVPYLRSPVKLRLGTMSVLAPPPPPNDGTFEHAPPHPPASPFEPWNS